MEELVKISNGTIEIANELMQQLRAFQIKKTEMDIKEKELKNALLNAMEQNNIKKIENDLVKITYKAPAIRKSVDTKALKEQGLYERFLVETEVKSSISLNWK